MEDIKTKEFNEISDELKEAEENEEEAVELQDDSQMMIHDLLHQEIPEDYQSGFIAVVGRPNAGKSTMMNAILNEKVAIMSDKPNTTRNNIAGILTKDDVQYVFMDTPGIHKPQQHLGKVLNKNAYIAMEDSDVIAWIIDITQAFGPGDDFILNKIKTLHKPVVLLVNKIDKLPREKVLKKLLYWTDKYVFNDVVPISAKDKVNLDELLKVFRQYLPKQPPLYPEEMKSDHSVNFQLCELVREKILQKTHDEIPHSIAVILERKEIEKGRMILSFLIIVDRDSQKGILIGKQGSMIRDIRIACQSEIREKVGMPVIIEFYVRVEKNWRNKEVKIKEFGLDELSE
ncbi:GTPase Era [Ileibacterium valens]|uniref:GTPase Era n=1 Tax=Ileibacterium valens TaxID=1862668 RepID=UPI003F73B384